MKFKKGDIIICTGNFAGLNDWGAEVGRLYLIDEDEPENDITTGFSFTRLEDRRGGFRWYYDNLTYTYAHAPKLVRVLWAKEIVAIYETPHKYFGKL